MTTIYIEQTYMASEINAVILPDGVKFSDIKQWYVKWGNFFYTLDNVTWSEIPTNVAPAVDDFKRPASVTIYNTLPDGSVDYDDILGSDNY